MWGYCDTSCSWWFLRGVLELSRHRIAYLSLMGRGNLVICGSLQQPGHHGLLRCLSLWWQQHFMVVSRSSKCHPTLLHPLLNEVRMWIGLRLTSLDADVSFVVRTGQPKTPDASRLPVLETPLIQWFMDVWWAIQAIHGIFFHDFYSDFMEYEWIWMGYILWCHKTWLAGTLFGDTRGYPHEYPHCVFPLMVDFRSQFSIILPLLMVISQFLIVSILLTPIRILESIWWYSN